jgi:carbamoyl-phosphate synthase large subunit
MDQVVRILFLGASRLVGLMERFHTAAAVEGVRAELISLDDASPWHPIQVAGVAQVIPGPQFLSPEFERFLVSLVREMRIQAVLPSIDPATIALAAAHSALADAGALAVVSSYALCKTMADKVLADEFFTRHALPVPDQLTFPLVAKPRGGSSSRGHIVFRDKEELEFWRARNDCSNYIIQAFIMGTEYSVDAFISADGHCLGAIPRQRIVTSGGEVMVTCTEQNKPVEELALRLLSLPGWFGPLNVQIMDTQAGPVLIEVNPRTGSGIPCGIEAGLDFPRWIIRQVLGRPIPTEPVNWKPGLIMTRSRKDYFIWSS